MARVLVTGATGFIGRHLVESLVRRGDKVRCYLRNSSNADSLAHLDAEIVRGSLDDQSCLRHALAGIDSVFHLAAMTSALTRAVLYRVNRDGCAQMARACAAQHTAPSLILISSIAAAGPTARGRTRQESDIASPVSHHGASKRAGELAAEQYAAVVPTSIVRPGIVFGPGNRELLPVFQAIATLRIHLVPTWDPPPLSLLHVTDLIDLMLRVERKGKRLGGRGSSRGGGYYFACAPEHPNYLQLGRMIADSLGIKRLLLLPLVNPLPWLVASLTQAGNRLRVLHDSLNIDKMREATAESWACSGELARRELGFVISHSLAERLRETADWYRSQGLLNPFRRRSATLTNATNLPPGRRDVA